MPGYLLFNISSDTVSRQLFKKLTEVCSKKDTHGRARVFRWCMLCTDIDRCDHTCVKIYHQKQNTGSRRRMTHNK